MLCTTRRFDVKSRDRLVNKRNSKIFQLIFASFLFIVVCKLFVQRFFISGFTVTKFIICFFDYVKNVRIRSFSSQYFLAFRLNMDQKNSRYSHFSRSVRLGDVMCFSYIFTWLLRSEEATFTKSSLLRKSSNKFAPSYKHLLLNDQALLTY